MPGRSKKQSKKSNQQKKKQTKKVAAIAEAAEQMSSADFDLSIEELSKLNSRVRNYLQVKFPHLEIADASASAQAVATSSLDGSFKQGKAKMAQVPSQAFTLTLRLKGNPDRELREMLEGLEVDEILDAKVKDEIMPEPEPESEPHEMIESLEVNDKLELAVEEEDIPEQEKTQEQEKALVQEKSPEKTTREIVFTRIEFDLPTVTKLPTCVLDHIQHHDPTVHIPGTSEGVSSYYARTNPHAHPQTDGKAMTWRDGGEAARAKPVYVHIIISAEETEDDEVADEIIRNLRVSEILDVTTTTHRIGKEGEEADRFQDKRLAIAEKNSKVNVSKIDEKDMTSRALVGRRMMSMGFRK